MEIPNRNIELFVRLGESLSRFGHTGQSRKVIADALATNPWFTHQEIVYAVKALRESMLDGEKLRAWLQEYGTPKNIADIAVITAGNIPLVGFFDILCVLISGHRCHLKTSSKDKALTGFILNELKRIDPHLPVYELGNVRPDALIATGSDNTNRYFRTLYPDAARLLRGNRFSVAILTGDETPVEIAGLASDIFTYSGLGCRNVCKLFVPEGYSIQKLVRSLAEQTKKTLQVNPKYVNNYLQCKALLEMRGERFSDGGFFVFTNSEDFPSYISEITCHTYHSIDGVESWLHAMRESLQCVVAGGKSGIGMKTTPFGSAQKPGLTDYPDGKDVMAFLRNIPLLQGF